MRVLILVLFFALPCFGAETLKATGTVRTKIVAPDVFEVPTVTNLTQDVPYVVVYTEQGATAQIVF